MFRETKNIIFDDKNLKHKTIILLKMFFVMEFFFISAAYQFFENGYF